jgi:hypothetical protein
VVTGTGAAAVETGSWGAVTVTGVAGAVGATDEEEAVELGTEASVGEREDMEAVEEDAEGKTRPFFVPSTVLRAGIATADLGEEASGEAICGAFATRACAATGGCATGIADAVTPATTEAFTGGKTRPLFTMPTATTGVTGATTLGAVARVEATCGAVTTGACAATGGCATGITDAVTPATTGAFTGGKTRPLLGATLATVGTSEGWEALGATGRWRPERTDAAVTAARAETAAV